MAHDWTGAIINTAGMVVVDYPGYFLVNSKIDTGIFEMACGGVLFIRMTGLWKDLTINDGVISSGQRCITFALHLVC